jgi:hypothetical protein
MEVAAPDLRFYTNRSLSGPPALRVDQHGAFVGDRQVCSWPESVYDAKNNANMVLGYRGRPEVGNAKYDGCPTGFPVISTWGDHGLGGAVLYVDVVSRKGPIAEVRFEGKPYYFDLNAIPGDPRRPDPALGRRPRGFLGWEWMGILEGK